MILRCLAAFSLLFASLVHAELDCRVDLQYGFIVNENRIRVVHESVTRYQINGDDQLIVGGQWIQLNDQQKQDIKTLSDNVHEVMPKMILLAVDGVELAIDTVQQVYTGLVGTDHSSYRRIHRALKRVKKKVNKKFVHSDSNYYIGPGSLENVEEFVDQELEEELEQAINTSVGGILSAIAGLSAGNDLDMEERINALSERLEAMDEHFESNIEPQAETLRKKARWFCERMESINEIEERLRASIPQLQPFDAIVVGE